MIEPRLTPTWTADDYERAAAEYQATLPLEHYMEGIPQGTQRMILTASLAALRAHRPRLQVLNELLVQYFFEGQLHQVVPDNMVRECDAPPVTPGSFNAELEPVGPLWVLEYVSDNSKGKDYRDSFAKYERELKVPYCLMYYPERDDFRFHRHDGERYQPVPADGRGRFPLPELEVSVGVLDGWVRVWHRDELILLPDDLMRQAAELEQRAEEAGRLAEQERVRADEAARRTEEERRRADDAARRADEATRLADEAARRADEERRQRLAADEELARLRTLLAQLQGQPPAAP